MFFFYFIIELNTTDLLHSFYLSTKLIHSIQAHDKSLAQKYPYFSAPVQCSWANSLSHIYNRHQWNYTNRCHSPKVLWFWIIQSNSDQKTSQANKIFNVMNKIVSSDHLVLKNEIFFLNNDNVCRFLYNITTILKLYREK